MKTIMQRAAKVSFTAVFLAAVGCVSQVEVPGPSPDTTNESPKAVASGVNGELLHTIRPAEGHTVDFYKLRHGHTAILEQHLADQPTLMQGMEHPDSLSTVFRALRPGEIVPEALVAADRYSEDMRKAGELISLEERGAPDLVQPRSTSSEGDIATQSQALTSCSGDAFGDGWGGQWFLDNFCNKGNFRFCTKNISQMAREVNGSFTWFQFEGDFANAGHMDTWHYHCVHLPFFSCIPELEWDFSSDIQPRQWIGWTYTSGGGHGGRGKSACTHMDLANGASAPSWEVNVNQGGLPLF